MAILVRLTLIVRYRRAPPPPHLPGGYFGERLGFNMWKSWRGYRQLIASCYFPPTGKAGKPAAPWISAGEGQDGDQQGMSELVIAGAGGKRFSRPCSDTISRGHRRNPSWQLRRKLLLAEKQRKKGKRKKNTSSPIITRPANLRRIRSSPPDRRSVLSRFPLSLPPPRPHCIAINATCSPGNNRFTSVSARNSRYTRRLAAPKKG